MDRREFLKRGSAAVAGAAGGTATRAAAPVRRRQHDDLGSRCQGTTKVDADKSPANTTSDSERSSSSS